MLAHSHELNTLTHLTTHVYETLCDHEYLEYGAFEMTSRVLMRGDVPCGIYFSLHGPRSVRLTAIWETDHNTVLFYDSKGERFARLLLIDAPSLSSDDREGDMERSPVAQTTGVAA